MNAKEKAEELVLKFLRIENNTPEWFNTHIAKQCALIAVNEIALKINGHHKDSEITTFIDYWQEVKTEINKL
jgi:hypothetical protein